MQFLLIVIEKAESGYTAYSPNLPGVTATSESREAVERGIMEAVEERIKALSKRDKGISLTYQPVETTIPCTMRGGCGKPAQKDGLCWQHWRQIYGHTVNFQQRPRRCLVCGETNQLTLTTWDIHCPGKQANPQWHAKLTAEKIEGRKRKAQARQQQRKQELYGSKK